MSTPAPGSESELIATRTDVAQSPDDSTPPTSTSATGRFHRWLSPGTTMARRHPVLCSLVVLVLGAGLIFFVRSFRAAQRSDEAERWLKSHGARVLSESKIGNFFMRQVYSVLYRRPVPLRPAFDFTIPSWMLKTHGDTIYDKLSDLRGITGLRFNHWRQPHPSEGFGPVATVVPFERVTIDSLRLQQLIFKQPAPIVLRVSDHTFSPIDTPLDLTGKLLFFELQCTELTRDAARGLPILKSWQQLTVRSSHIDENAVDILLERLQGDKLFLEHCIMNAKTHARLAAIKRVALVTPNVYEDDPVMPSEAAAAGPPENPASSNP